MRKKQIRFWQWVNDGAVKLKINDGQVLRWWHGGPTDEGFHSVTEEWHYAADKGRVYSETHSFGRDCDGPYEFHWEGFAPVEDLYLLEIFMDDEKDCDENIRLPKWRQTESYVRDVYAERMGY